MVSRSRSGIGNSAPKRRGGITKKFPRMAITSSRLRRGTSCDAVHDVSAPNSLFASTFWTPCRAATSRSRFIRSPSTSRKNFGMAYTQDESYYCSMPLLALPSTSASVTASIVARWRVELMQAQTGKCLFDVEKFVNRWRRESTTTSSSPLAPFTAPAQTMSYSKSAPRRTSLPSSLWTGARLGLDHRPRPVHLQHGLANIQWDRDIDWVRLRSSTELKSSPTNDHSREERPGLHGP